MTRRALGSWAAVFALSGACGLLYELVWVKAFALVLGSSSLALATVSAAFMAGLALGSALAARTVDGSGRPLALYAGIELGIAVAGGLSLAILGALDPALGALHRAATDGNAVAWPALARLALTGAVVLVPTALMGASLPALVAGIARASDGGVAPRALALLYCANTAGGCMGAVAGGLVLLPTLGLTRTLYATASASVAVAAAAFALAHRTRGRERAADTLADAAGTVVPPAIGPGSRTDRRDLALLGALAVGGMLALGLQVAGTRLLVPVLGASSLAYTAILGTALAAIATGSLGVALLGRRAPAGPGGIAVLFLVAGAGTVATAVAGNHLPELFRAIARTGLGDAANASQSGGEATILNAFVALAGAALAIPLCALGAVLPLGTIALQGNAAGRSAGRACAANTVGAVVGALGTALVLLPAIGLEGTLHALALAMLATGAALACLAASRGWRASFAKALALCAPAVGAALLLGTDQARLDVGHLHWGVFRWILSPRPMAEYPAELAFSRDGASSTVTVFRTPDMAYLKVNGKSDGASRPPDLVTQYHLGHLPLLFVPAPRRVLIIGLGTGATACAAAAHGPERVDVVELEPAMREAARHFAVVNDGVPDDLSLVHVHMDDGRSFLAHGSGTYDAIISEPSNPWIAGTSALFTLELYARARARLAPDGVFCQWIQCYELSRETLDAMVLGLFDAFGHVAIFQRNSDLVCVASASPLRVDRALAEARLARPRVRATLARIDESTLADLLLGVQAVLPREAALFHASWRNRDDTMLLEHKAPLEMYRGLSPGLASRPLAEQLRLAAEVLGESDAALATDMARALARHEPERADEIDELADGATNEPELVSIAAWARARHSTRQRAKSLLESTEQDLAAGAIGRAEKRVAALVADPAVEPAARLRGLRLLGQALLRLERFGPAQQAFERAVELYADDYASRTWLGLLAARRGDLARGAMEVARALDTAPRYVPAHAARIALAVASGQARDADAARADARAAVGRARFREIEALALALVAEGYVEPRR